MKLHGLAKMAFFCACLLFGSFFGKVWKENVHVIDPNDNKNLPIYCVDTKKKEIALTFDVAWGKEDLVDILSILEKAGVKATFFVTGEWVRKYPEDAKRLCEKGHELGNHGDNHKYMTRLSMGEQKKEILDLHEKVKDLTGVSMKLFRPPYGDYDASVILTARKCGYEAIQWSVDSLDWKDYGVLDIVSRTVEHKNLENGAILLLHTGTLYTRDALELLIDSLKQKGYRLVLVSELIYKKNFVIDYSGKQFLRKNAKPKIRLQGGRMQIKR